MKRDFTAQLQRDLQRAGTVSILTSTGLTSQRARANKFRAGIVFVANTSARLVVTWPRRQLGSVSRLDQLEISEMSLKSFSEKPGNDRANERASERRDRRHARLAAMMFAFLQRAIGIETFYSNICISIASAASAVETLRKER